MSKNNENKLVPNLRFPEFKNSGEWEMKRLGHTFDLIDGFSFSSSDFSDKNANSKQIIRITDINNKNKNEDKVYISIDRIKELKIEKHKIAKGDLLLSLTGAAGFNFFIWNSEDDAYINQRTMKISPKNRENKALAILLEPLIHKKINSIGTGQNNNLSKEALKDISLPIPLPAEQQKIAACLSSIDDLITAESQKLEVLQQHKKGLLQNLFPQEGETVPKLRFKEFEGSGEWEVKELGEVGTFVNEKTQLENLSINSYISTENLLPDYGGVTLSSKLPSVGNFTKYRTGDILISNIRPYLKKVWFSDRDGACSNDVIVIRANSAVSEVFLSYLLRNDAFISYIMKNAEGVKMPRGDKDSIRKYFIAFPKDTKEQPKIAACLSSLDDLITAQRQKIEWLQQHKKGLLQGLFPNINDGYDG